MTGKDAPPAESRDVLDRLGVPMPGTTKDPQEAVRTIARQMTSLVRISLVPAAIVAGLVTPGVSAWYWLVIAVQLLWKLTATAPSFSRGTLPPPPAWLSDVVDLLGLFLLLVLSGGSTSPLRVAMVVLPFVGGFLLAPRAAALVGAGSLGVYLGAAAPDLLAGRESAGAIGILVLIFASAVAGVTVAELRERATAHLRAIDAGRRRLLATGMSAEDRERRRVSQQLHGDALQRLLAATQDLEESDSGALSRAREGVRTGVAGVRDTVRDLHPATLRHAGLEPALRAALEHRARNVIAARVIDEIEPAREGLLLAVVREIGDVLAGLELDHDVAARVSVEHERPVLTLSTTCDPGRAGALDAGLRGCAERVGADGGELTCTLKPDGRAKITIRLGHGRDRTFSTDLHVTDDLQRGSQLLFSVARAFAPPTAVLVALVGGEPTIAFYALLGLAACCDAATVALLLRPRAWRVRPTWLMTVATVLSAAALTQQGDTATPLAASALSLPVLLTMTFSPRGVLVVSALAALVLGVGFAPSVLDGSNAVRASALVLAAAYAWAVASSVVVATGRERLLRRRFALEQGRRRLLQHGLGVADAERQRLSEALHDGALQELMIAGQDLDEALEGDPAALDSARAALRAGVAQLRDAVTDLHPPALEHGGLRPALTSIVERACRRTGPAFEIEVGPQASGCNDELMINLVRELATNVCKHANAEHLWIRALYLAGRLELVVADDGVGTTHDRIADAVADGHIGLAAARERVEADGGTLIVDSSPGYGTTVTASLPAADVGAELPVVG